jgi:hypothetical protein
MQAIKLGVKRLDDAPIDGIHQSVLKKGYECSLRRSRLGGEERGRR